MNPATKSETKPTRHATPVDRMLDSVEWSKCNAPIENPEGLPFPTHQGILKVGSLELECYVLNNGQRVFSGEAIEQFLQCLSMCAACLVVLIRLRLRP